MLSEGVTGNSDEERGGGGGLSETQLIWAQGEGTCLGSFMVATTNQNKWLRWKY